MGETCFILHLVCVLTLSVYTAGFRPNPLPSSPARAEVNRPMKQSRWCAPEVNRLQVIHRSGWDWARCCLTRCLDLAARFQAKDNEPARPETPETCACQSIKSRLVGQVAASAMINRYHRPSGIMGRKILLAEIPAGQYPVSPLTIHSGHLKKINTYVSVFKTQSSWFYLLIQKELVSLVYYKHLLRSHTCALMKSKEWRLSSMVVIHNLQIATAHLESWKSSAAHTKLTHDSAHELLCFQIHFDLVPRLFLFRLMLHLTTLYPALL